jgi:hypothetical protein
MSRTVAEVEADIASAKASGEKPMGKRLRALRDELKAATAPACEVVASAAPAPAARMAALNTPDPLPDSTEAIGRLSSYVREMERTNERMAAETPDPFDTDEWRFIDRACSEIKIEADGSMGNAVKKVYNELDAKVKVWRIARQIVAQVGIGNKWPQWVTLGRNPSTGEKEAPKPPPVQKARPLPPPSAADDEASAYAMAAIGSVAAQIGARALPPRMPETVGV